MPAGNSADTRSRPWDLRGTRYRSTKQWRFLQRWTGHHDPYRRDRPAVAGLVQIAARLDKIINRTVFRPARPNLNPAPVS